MSFLNRFLEAAPVEDTKRSVVRNLSYLFNSRPDYASQLRDFGIGDYLSQQGRKGVHLSILREMQQLIANYESRFLLREIKTLGRDSDLKLHILLRGTLRAAKQETLCHLLVLFHLPSGAVEVTVDPAGESRRGA